MRAEGQPVHHRVLRRGDEEAETDLVRRVNQVLVDYRRGGADSPWMRAYTIWLAADMKGIPGPPAPKYR